VAQFVKHHAGKEAHRREQAQDERGGALLERLRINRQPQ
jgi:hypothetical protein